MVTKVVERRLNERALSAMLWAAVAKAASKEVEHDALPRGEQSKVRLMITGEIDGQTVHRSLLGELAVGEDQQRAMSATPDQATLVALILAKLNRITREKILAELPLLFAAHGDCWPEVDGGLLSSAERMLKQIRARKTVTVRGSVRYKYDVTSAAVSSKRSSEHGAQGSVCREQRRCADSEAATCRS